MIATDMAIDITRLEKVRHIGGKVIARCPACAAVGNDRRGDHLAILPTGKFACAASPGDSEHRREIFALVGIRGERRPDPERDRRWRLDRDMEQRRISERAELADAAREQRAGIIRRWAWHPADVWEDSPQRIDCQLVESDPRHFLASLFPLDAVIWTGQVHESGTRHANRWRTTAEWLDADPLGVGPMTCPATWPAGTTSRTAANVGGMAPFAVLDFDGVGGRKPETPAEIEENLAAARAITRWLRDGLGWQLAAIVATGGKSLHCWFNHPGSAALQSLRTAATALGIDAGLIGRPEHPCRLPGQTHAETRGVSRTLWLQNSTE